MMDNATFYQEVVIQELIELAGCRLLAQKAFSF